jgi:peptidoglycan/LPS O-acetylase OafA/YrhL
MSATAAQASAPSPAVAPPPGNPRFALFDSLRGIAILAVVTFHVVGIAGDLGRRVVGDVFAILGPQAPILFFAISGFLLYRPYVAARAAGAPSPSLARYARRRVLRIVPAYWLALTVLAIYPGIVGVFSSDWWRYYFFLQLYSHDTYAGGISVAWTLCVEASFYLALPFWALAVRRLGVELLPLALVALGGAAIQVAAAHNDVSDLVASTALGQCTWIALGMALAVASVAVERGPREPGVVRFVTRRPGACWWAAAAAFAGLVIVLRSDWVFAEATTFTAQAPVLKTVLAIAFSATLAVLLMAPAVFGERAGGVPRRVLAVAPLAWLGVLSYSIYLWHLPVAELLGLSRDPAHISAHGLDLASRIDHLTAPILFVVVLAVSLAIAIASYRLVELPFLRRKER